MIEKKINRKLMYRGSMVTFYRDEVLINNKTTYRDVCVLNSMDGTIQAFCYDKYKNVYLVQQYRHVKKSLSKSCVGGYIEKNESVELALIREIKEELGAKVVSYKKLFSLNPLVAYSYEQTHYYCVEISPDLKYQNLDEFEDISILKITLAEFHAYASSTDCSSANVKIFSNYLKLNNLI